MMTKKSYSTRECDLILRREFSIPCRSFLEEIVRGVMLTWQANGPLGTGKGIKRLKGESIKN